MRILTCYGIFFVLLAADAPRGLGAQQHKGQETVFKISAMLIWMWYCVKRLALGLLRGWAGALAPRPALLRDWLTPSAACTPSARKWVASLWPAPICLPALFLPVPAPAATR